MKYPMPRRASLVFLLAGLVGPAPAQPPAAPANRFEPQIRQFEEADRQSPPPQGAVLFVGSSSIRMWKGLAEDFPGVKVINRGFGGSQMEDSVYFADRIITPYRPRMVVVYAGDNDLAAGKTPQRVLADYQALVRKIHAKLPETRIAFIAVKPSLSRWKLVDRVREANDLVRRYTARDPRLVYLDVFTPMLGSDGTPRKELFLKDGLHMTAEGYAVWKSVIAPAIR